MSELPTILILDDEPDVVKCLTDLLQPGYRVVEATDPRQAIRLLEQEKFHAVLTDQRMPGMTGIDFLNVARKRQPEAVRILLTGYADIRAVIAAINEGDVYRYVNKPWDPEELQAIVRDACDRYALVAQRDHLLARLVADHRQQEEVGQDQGAASGSEPARPRLRRHTLLVLDDEPDVVRSVKDLLRLDYRVIGSWEPEQAVRLLEQEQFHAVLSDERMPGMTGLQFLKTVRERQPRAMRILFSGYTNIRVLIAAINEGNVYRFIPKPLDPGELEAVVRDACNQYESRAEREQLLARFAADRRPREKAGEPVAAYAGDAPFVFVSYSHRDKRAVYSEIARLSALGYRIWYDEGIRSGTDWTDAIASAIERCCAFLSFLSPVAVESEHVLNEVNLALDLKKPLVVVHLERTVLPAGLRLRLIRVQALFKHELANDTYCRRLAHSLANDVLGPEPSGD